MTEIFNSYINKINDYEEKVKELETLLTQEIQTSDNDYQYFNSKIEGLETSIEDTRRTTIQGYAKKNFKKRLKKKQKK